MSITKYHAKYYAHEIIRKKTHEGIGQLGQSIFNSSVEIKPHQVDAALFAYRSPLSKGVLLADEVGLGKTIEAGLVIAQHWAERKRKILIIVPSSLRKQWQNELKEKFFIPSNLLETKNYKKYIKKGIDPFESKKIVIMSIHFAAKHKDEIRLKNWDLAIIDEAHKLRNIRGKLSSSILWSLEETKKLLLTATPLQNNLIELFNISKFIDDKIFGEKAFFNRLYKKSENIQDLRDQLKNFCKRSLRNDVKQYIDYKERIPLTISFTPTDKEVLLYNKISSFLQRDESYALPNAQKQLIVMVVRKILGSSSIALVDTLKIIKGRLENLKSEHSKQNENKILDFIDDDELLESEEIEDFEEYLELDENSNDGKKIDINEIRKEIKEIEEFIELAKSIEIDSKTNALKNALNEGFKKLKELGANKKALIFTESRRTQNYLYEYLINNGYEDKVILFNGSNNSDKSKKIYEEWLSKNKNTGNISGSKSADKRMAIIDHFKNNTDVMIATESASEGVNLQFCSLIINYDLPWNPQRIEQRIGRCHRYGQKHDVVVINFLNRKNEAERRVLQLLQDKFHLFNGVFGSSNEILGAIESDMDFEKSIYNIFQKCRTNDEINKAFDKLQKQFEFDIKQNMKKTYEKIFKYFDEDVHEKLKITQESSKQYLDSFTRKFWDLTKFILDGKAFFEDDKLTFELKEKILPYVKIGKYFVNIKKEDIHSDFVYRTTHPIGEHVINNALELSTEIKKVDFNLSEYEKKITVLNKYKNKSGYLSLDLLKISSYEDEEYLLFTGFTEDGNMIDKEIIEKMFLLSGKESFVKIDNQILNRLKEEAEILKDATIQKSTELNNKFFLEESQKIDRWADSKIQELTENIKKAKNELRNTNNEMLKAENSEEIAKLEIKKKNIRKKINRLRNERDDKEENIEEKRVELITKMKKKIINKQEFKNLFIIKWSII